MSVSLNSSGRGRTSVTITLGACSWFAFLHPMWLAHFTWVTLSPTPFRTLWLDGKLKFKSLFNIATIFFNQFFSFAVMWRHHFVYLCFSVFVQAQDARWNHLVESWLWSCWYCHSGSGGKEADEREGHEPSRPWQGKLHSGSLEMEERVSEGNSCTEV